MMQKIFNLTSTFKSHTDEDGSVKIRGMASTAELIAQVIQFQPTHGLKVD